MKFIFRSITLLISSILLSMILLQTCQQVEYVAKLENQDIIVLYDSLLHSKIASTQQDILPMMTSFQPSEYIITDLGQINDFTMTDIEHSPIEEEAGSGNQITITGISQNENISIEKKIESKTFKDFPNIVFTSVHYKNLGKTNLTVKKWINNSYKITPQHDAVPFWSFQGGTYESRPDWVLPVKPGFYQENYMGMNASDYGGGIPVSDVWSTDGGLAVGHVEEVPKLVSIPVDMKSDSTTANVSVQYAKTQVLAPEEILATFQTFVMIHRGDFYNSLARYSAFMQKQGIKFAEQSESAYEPVWCAWGYERNFELNQVLGTLPKVKELGFKWAVLDDGWQTAEGDWYLDKTKFPNGDKDMQAFVKKIHENGLKAKLWWAPLAVDPGTDLYRDHADFLLINKSGNTQDISWWDSYYLCPAYHGTIDYTKSLVKKILTTWGYDGLKIDGQHLNAAPPCYNPSHKHAYPEESFEKLPDFFRMIYKTAMEINPKAVVEICPCGTACSFYIMPYMNQPVSSDPMSSWQIRLKGKTYKAILGPQTAYYGDHVELSDNGNDYASTLGIGGIIGTKFTWPENVQTGQKYTLTPDREKRMKKWMRIYQDHSLAKGEYLGELYDIGYDEPEMHAIRYNNKYYYACYDSSFQGTVEFRGIPEGSYKITDYENGVVLGTVHSGHPYLSIEFKDHLLIMLEKD